MSEKHFKENTTFRKIRDLDINAPTWNLSADNKTLSVSQNTAAIYIWGKPSTGSTLADEIAGNSCGTDFFQSSTVAQDGDDLIEALICLQAGEQFDILLHNKRTTFCSLSFFFHVPVVQVSVWCTQRSWRLIADLVFDHHCFVYVFNNCIDLFTR